MTKLNFQLFRIPTGIDKTQNRTGDARESVANMLYLNVNGIRAHALAMKIYRNEGAADYTNEEGRTLTKEDSSYGTPAFIEGLSEQIYHLPNSD